MTKFKSQRADNVCIVGTKILDMRSHVFSFIYRNIYCENIIIIDISIQHNSLLFYFLFYLREKPTSIQADVFNICEFSTMCVRLKFEREKNHSGLLLRSCFFFRFILHKQIRSLASSTYTSTCNTK